MKKLLNKIRSAFSWRYHLYIEPVLDLYGSFWSFLEFYSNLLFKFDKGRVVYIYANKRNVGDYISHKGIKLLLGHSGVDLYCSKAWRTEFEKYIHKAHKSKKVAVVGGGGLLQPAFEDFWEKLLASEIKFYCVGIGINFMNGRPLLKEELIRDIVSRSEMCLVRDNFTFDTLSNLLDESSLDKLRLTACPSINFINHLRKNNRIELKAAQKTLVHVFHPSDLRLSGANIELIRQNVMDYAKSRALEYIETDNMSNDHIKSISLINNAELVVSSRLHGCIIAFSCQKRFIPLVCDNKTREFVESHTESEWIFANEFEKSEVVQDVCDKALQESSLIDSLTLTNTIAKTEKEFESFKDHLKYNDVH